jgi:hypothetical protein
MRMQDLIATTDCAQILGITCDGVRWLTRAGRLRAAAVLPSGQRLYERAEVLRIAQRRRQHLADFDELFESSGA